MPTRRDFLELSAAAVASYTATQLPVANCRADDLPNMIIDVHQHLWDLSKLKLPWLDDAPEVLRHTHHLREYREATQGLTVRSVYMEVHVDPAQLVDEAEHVIGLCRDGTGPTVAAVIGGRPESPQFGSYIGRFKESPYVKGVRRVLHTPETAAGFCLEDQFVQNVRLLGERGLRCDLCMRPAELGDAAKLAERCPDTRFILDHCGNADPKAFGAKRPGQDPPEHSADDWKRSIELIAKRPNTICKISGIVARLPKGGDASDLSPIVNHCMDSFGPDRVVFGSDWPVCLLGSTLRNWIDMLSQIIRSRPAGEQQKLWSENAKQFYALRV